jgi:hypothetical protein
MFTHDPFQTHQTPFGLPIQALQPSFNPMALAGQQFPNTGFGGYGINPQQLQALALNPLLAATLHNPYLTNPMINPQLAYQSLLQQGQQQQWNPQQQLYPQQQQFYPQQQGYLQQQGWPQHQQQQQFGYPLAPQSLIGGGLGQPEGQIPPLAQLALRQASGYGISPFVGCF